MALEDREIFHAVFARYSDQPIEFIMEQYEKAKRLNMEIEKRQSLVGSTDVLFSDVPPVPPLPSLDGKDAMPEEPAPRKRLTRRSLVADPATAITDDGITCCLCGERRTTLTARHLAIHDVTVDEYRKLCGYPEKQALMGLNHAARMRENAVKAQKARLAKKG